MYAHTSLALAKAGEKDGLDTYFANDERLHLVSTLASNTVVRLVVGPELWWSDQSNLDAGAVAGSGGPRRPLGSALV